MNTTQLDEVSTNQPTGHTKRPGPFGPAWALIPRDQQVLTIDADKPAHEAVDRMIDNRFSQLPVTDDQSRIIGVFTWASFGSRAADFRGQVKMNAADMPVRDFMETPRFIDPQVYIDTETDWGNIDYVLVGDPGDLLGILCIADVLARLNDFAEAFVLIYEIEHEIRDLIGELVDDTELKVLIDNMNIPAQARRPESLVDFTFDQYRSLMCSKSTWPKFEPLFQTKREVVNNDLEDITKLRNVVFHFRRGITNRDTDRLRRFRDKLRFDRGLWAKRYGTGDS